MEYSCKYTILTKCRYDLVYLYSYFHEMTLISYDFVEYLIDHFVEIIKLMCPQLFWGSVFGLLLCNRKMTMCFKVIGPTKYLSIFWAIGHIERAYLKSKEVSERLGLLPSLKAI